MIRYFNQNTIKQASVSVQNTFVSVKFIQYLAFQNPKINGY